MANMQTDPYREVGSSLGWQRDDGGRDGRHQPARSAFAYTEPPDIMLSRKLLGFLLFQ